MTPCRVLYLDSHRLTAFLWQGGTVTTEGMFEIGGDDLPAFSEYLKGRPRSLYYLLANSAEEGYQQEVIPFLQGSNRSALVTRKLGQYFFATPLTTSLSLGFEKDRRKNEKLLLSALTNPGQFDPWLTAIRETGVPLAGIYTPAQLGGALLGRLGHASERSLLLTVQDNSIRESFVVNGITVFSRMAPFTDSSHAGIASGLAAEAGKLHQYLLGQRLIGRNEHLNVYVLAHPLAANAIRTSCIDTGGLSFVLLDNHAAAARIGLKTMALDSRAEALFVHLLATKPPRQQYAPEELRHDYRLAQIRSGLVALTAIALISGLLFAGKQFYEVFTARQQIGLLELRASEMQQRYQSLTGTFPQVEASTDELRQVTGRYIELQGRQGGPEKLFQKLSAVLDRHPGIELEGIEWKQGGNTKAAPADPFTESALVSGNVRLKGSPTPRQTIATFEAFVQALSQLPGINIEVTQSPYDIEPGRALKSSGRDDESLKQQPFALRLQQAVQP
ncbi:MAG TPA: hypothetical protein PLW86_07760 [Rhodocyclaceae bacterium]|nr:hypothetical protein [Rhodocyclaceae bacterium]